MLGWRICRNAALAKDWWPCCPLSDQPGHGEARAAMTRGRKRNKRSRCPILRTELNQSLHGEQPVLLQTLCSAQGSSHGHACVFTTPPAPLSPFCLTQPGRAPTQPTLRHPRPQCRPCPGRLSAPSREGGAGHAGTCCPPCGGASRSCRRGLRRRTTVPSIHRALRHHHALGGPPRPLHGRSSRRAGKRREETAPVLPPAQPASPRLISPSRLGRGAAPSLPRGSGQRCEAQPPPPCSRRRAFAFTSAPRRPAVG